MICFDLVWFNLIQFDLIWFNSRKVLQVIPDSMFDLLDQIIALQAQTPEIPTRLEKVDLFWRFIRFWNNHYSNFVANRIFLRHNKGLQCCVFISVQLDGQLNSGLDFDPHSILDYLCPAIYVLFHRNETELVYNTKYIFSSASKYVNFALIE